MKMKVFLTALTVILLSVVFADTAEAQGRGYYNRGRGCAPQYAPRPNCNNYSYNGGYYNRGYNCAPRGYARGFRPAYYNGNGYYGGGYATTTVTYTVNGGNCNNGYYNNNVYYNNGYNNGGCYNNGNGYRRGPRRGW